MGREIENRKVYISINGKEIKNTYRDIRNEVYNLRRQLQNTTRGTKEFEAVSRNLKNAEREFANVRKEVGYTQRGIRGLGGGLASLKNAFVALGAIEIFRQVALDVFNLRKEMGKLGAVLKNALQDNLEAEGTLSMIQDFAQNTPFSVRELTNSFVKLVNQGIKPTREELTKMGDLSAAVGKDFDQLTEAILDAQTGEFERLKEFGIRASKQGDKVTFSFKGQEKQVKFTKDAITDYIYSLGELEGVQGSMESISNELAGATSNLGDAYDNLLNTIFKNDTALTKLIKTTSSMLDVLRESVRAGGMLSKAEVDDINREAEKSLKRSMKRIQEAAGENKEAWKDWEGRIRTSIATLDKRIEESDGKVSAQVQLRNIKMRDNYLQLLTFVKDHTGEVQQETLKQIQDRKKAEKEIQDFLLKASGSEEEQIRAKYQKLIDLAKKHKVDLVDELLEQMNAEILEKVTEQAQKEIEAEKKKLEEKKRQAEEFAKERERLLDQYGLISDEEKLDSELNGLKAAYDQGLLSLEEYQAAQDQVKQVYSDLQVERDQEQHEIWLKLQEERLQKSQEFISAFAGLIASLKQAELSSIKEVSEKDFEVQKQRGESEEAFQRRKAKAEQDFSKAKEAEEKKRRSISKKYAVAEALSSVAQIGVNTAEAIMKALAVLGPIAGAVAAGVIGATGVVQAGVALDNVSQIRGYAEGGITKGLGFRDSTGFQVAGVVHEDEQVIPKWMRQSPRYAKTLDALEYARANNIGRFSGGGVAASSSSERTINLAPLDVGEFKKGVMMFNDTIGQLTEKGVLAVADDDFERAMRDKRERDNLIIDNTRL